MSSLQRSSAAERAVIRGGSTASSSETPSLVGRQISGGTKAVTRVQVGRNRLATLWKNAVLVKEKFMTSTSNMYSVLPVDDDYEQKHMDHVSYDTKIVMRHIDEYEEMKEEAEREVIGAAAILNMIDQVQDPLQIPVTKVCKEHISLHRRARHYAMSELQDPVYSAAIHVRRKRNYYVYDKSVAWSKSSWFNLTGELSPFGYHEALVRYKDEPWMVEEFEFADLWQAKKDTPFYIPATQKRIVDCYDNKWETYLDIDDAIDIERQLEREGKGEGRKHVVRYKRHGKTFHFFNVEDWEVRDNLEFFEPAPFWAKRRFYLAQKKKEAEDYLIGIYAPSPQEEAFGQMAGLFDPVVKKAEPVVRARLNTRKRFLANQRKSRARSLCLLRLKKQKKQPVLVVQAEPTEDTSSWLPIEEVVTQSRPSDDHPYDEPSVASMMSSVSTALNYLAPEVKQIGLLCIDIAACVFNISCATTRVEFMSQLYVSLRLLCSHFSQATLDRIVGSIMHRFEVQAGVKDLWRGIADCCSQLYNGVADWITCPMVDLLIDLLNVFVFAGILKEETINVLDQPGYKMGSLKIKREVTGMFDVLVVLGKFMTMTTECIATYFEDGVIDFTGWALGSKKEVFVRYATLMAEKSDAILGQLDSPTRAKGVKFRSNQEFHDVLNEVIDACTMQIHKAKLYDKTVYTRMLKDCMQVKSDITTHFRCSTARLKPYTFSVFGTTSQMKSTVSQAVWRQVAAANGIDARATNYCTVNFKDEYFSEVQQQEVLVIDDFMNEKETSAQRINPIRILLDWSSNVSVQLPAAAIEEKGKRYCAAKILGITCHDMTFHAETMSHQPGAAYRRIEIYIETALRPEFRRQNGQPDYDKIPREDYFPDIWNFWLWECEIEGANFRFKKLTEHAINNVALMEYVTTQSRRHFEIQRSIVEKLNDPSGWICPHGNVGGACKQCNPKLESQSLVVTSPSEEIDERELDLLYEGYYKDYEHLEALKIHTACYLLGAKYSEVRDRFFESQQKQGLIDKVACLRQKRVRDDDPIFDLPAELSEIDSQESLSVQACDQPFRTPAATIPARTYTIPPLDGRMNGGFYHILQTSHVRQAFAPLSYREAIHCLARIYVHHMRELGIDVAPNFICTRTSIHVHLFVLGRFCVECGREYLPSGEHPPPADDNDGDERDPPLCVQAEPRPLSANVEAVLKTYYSRPWTLTGKLSRWFVVTALKRYANGEKATIPFGLAWFGYGVLSYVKWVALVFGTTLATGRWMVRVIRGIYRLSHLFSFRNPWPFIREVMFMIRIEWRMLIRPLLLGDNFSRWLDNQLFPEELRRTLLCQRAQETGGWPAFVQANIRYRVAPVPSTLEMYVGAVKGTIVKQGLNFIGLASAAVAFYSFIVNFRDLKFLEGATNLTGKAIVEKINDNADSDHWQECLAAQRASDERGFDGTVYVPQPPLPFPKSYKIKYPRPDKVYAPHVIDDAYHHKDGEQKWQTRRGAERDKRRRAIERLEQQGLPYEELSNQMSSLDDENYIESEELMAKVKELETRIDQMEVNASDVGIITPLPGEHKDSWVKPAPLEFHLGQASLTTRPDDLMAKLKRNLVYAEVKFVTEDGPRIVNVHALAVGGADWLIPTHVVNKPAEDFTFVGRLTPDESAAPHAIGTFHKDQCVEIPDTDFSLVRIQGTIPKCGLVQFFPLDHASGCSAQLIHSVDGVLETSPVRFMPRPAVRPTEHQGKEYKSLNVYLQKDYPVATYNGLCGAVWMGNVSSKPFIHSMHICGAEGTRIGGSVVILQQHLMDAIKQLDAKMLGTVVAEEFPLNVQGREWTPEVNKRHFLHFITPNEEQTPVLDIIGTHGGHSGKYKQDIRKSLIADALSDRLGWEPIFKPVPHPNSSMHFNHAMEELAYPRNNFEPSILRKATEDLRDKFLKHVRSLPNLSEMVRPLVDTAVVSGLDGVVGIDKMNPRTSAGFPERGPKGRFYVPGDLQVPVSQPFTLDDEHLVLACEMEKQLLKGQRVYAPFTLSVKIEPVKVTKKYARLFGASNMIFTFVFRKYFLSIFRLIQLSPFSFETALGINCHSHDWDELTKFMEFKDRIIEGDYQTYDKTMGAAIILQAFSILIDIAREAGYSEDQLRIMTGLAHEVAFPTYEGRGVLFVVGGSNPSGHPGTFVINCIVNSLFMRYAYYWAARNLFGTVREMNVPFDRFVRLVTAGDDHLASVSPDCTWFNQLVVQNALATIRVGYTDGKKNPIFESEFISIHDASFVSRGFRYCAKMERWVAPLALKSLQKSYMIHNFGDDCPFSPEELIAIVVAQNEVELFLLGEERFNLYNDQIRGAMVDSGLAMWLPPYHEWDHVAEILRERTQPAFKLETVLQTLDLPDPIINRIDVPDIIHHLSPLVTIEEGSETSSKGSDDKVLEIQARDMGVSSAKSTAPATNNNNMSTNGMTGGANVVHDKGSALAWSTSRGTTTDGTRDIYQNEVDSLASYLERPVLIAAMDWGIGSTLYNTYNVLTLILNNTPIQNKLQNFANIMFDLEIDFEVNANPFLYGMLMINWVPWPRYDSLTTDRGLIYEDNVAASQRQRIFIDASTSSGGKMVIPFYWPTNYFSLVKDAPNDFGYLSCRQLSPLMHVTGASQLVTVYIRARMINVRLHTSTSQAFGAQPVMSVQADESPNDKPSSIATRVAGVAKGLEPVFGGYATATAAAASASAGLLRAMGLAHPRSKEMVHKIENRPLGNVANFNVPANALSLGIDEHNQVTIDPFVASLKEDEMSLRYILQKESFVGTFPWSLTNAENTVLATINVHPFQFMRNTSLGEYHLSSLAYVSRLFQFWTGTIKYRFQIVSSKWHRGRLRIIHDPVVQTSVANTSWQTNLQTVVDITEERDFTIEVHYVQGHAYSQTGSIKTCPPSFYALASGLNYTPSALVESNGVLNVVVMNRLVIPDDTVVAPVNINLFVSAGDDFQLSVPYDTLSDSSLINPSSTSGSQTITTGQRELSLFANTYGVPALQSSGAYAATVAVTGPSSLTYVQAPWWYISGAAQIGSMTLTNTSGTTRNVTATTSGGSATHSIPASSSVAFAISSAPGTVNGSGTLSVAIKDDTPSGSTTYRIDGATLPVRPGYQWRSAIDPTFSFLRYDGLNDTVTFTSPGPPPSYPVQMELAGAPTILWRTTGSSKLYGPGGNGSPVYVLSAGPMGLTNGVYSPFVQTWGGASTAPAQTAVTPTGVGTYSYTTFELLANLPAGGTTPGVLYDAVFSIPALTVQAEDAMDETIADPTSPPLQAPLHDTSIPMQVNEVYFGEKILHLRQIIGRPVYCYTYYLTPPSTLGLTRNTIYETDIPEVAGAPGYPAGPWIGSSTPFMFMFACYNGWRGTVRAKYVLNGAPTGQATFARVERESAQVNGRGQALSTYDLSTASGLINYNQNTTSMWQGVAITNPQLANEIFVEFPWYYRFRFRSARVNAVVNMPSTCNSHQLTVDFTAITTNQAYVDRYFQPGDDFTLLNWVGTPVLY